MPAEADTPRWWLERLELALINRRPTVAGFEDYFAGRHTLPPAPAKAADAFRRLLAMCSTNWCELVVDAAVERLVVDGFRFGDSPSADDAAVELWHANGLDADSEELFSTSVSTGVAYLSVWPDDERPGTPRISIETPHETIVELDPGDRRHRRAALKLWADDVTGTRKATLYLPDQIYKYEAPYGHSNQLRNDLGGVPSVLAAGAGGRWERRTVAGEPWPLPNRLGVVPIVPMPNKPWKGRTGRSDLAPVVPIQDRINKTVLDRLMAGEYGAFRQRWVTGMSIPEDPETHEPIEPFDAAVDRVWTFEPLDGEQVRVGEFSATDLGPFIRAVEADVQAIAAITRTPPHYLLGQSGSFPSGDSLKATETGLVAKVIRKQRVYGDALGEVMRLAFLAANDGARADAAARSAHVMWTDPESRSFGELVDGLLKLSSLGVPNRILWERANFRQPEIERFAQLAEEDAARAASAGFANVERLLEPPAEVDDDDGDAGDA